MMDSITDALENTRLSDLEQVHLRPQDSGTSEIDNVPSYLFRVASPLSYGETNERWVLSESVYQNRSSSTEDIFSNLDNEKRTRVAEMLNLHLRWWPQNGDQQDNFVSWTSSLLFAIQYIYYRHLSRRDGSDLADIKLYVIDTARFPRGTFIRDMDLIDIFCESDESLKDFQSLRQRPDYYFGEYLSQGALEIKNKCQVIPAEILFEQGRLRRIQPQFAELQPARGRARPEWAKEVIRLRRTIYPNNLPVLSLEDMLARLEAIEEIIHHVAPDWRFPIAIYLAALMGSESLIEGKEMVNDSTFFSYFRSKSFKEEGFNPSNFKVIAPDTMPELKQVNKLVHEISKYLQMSYAMENGYAFLTADPHKMLARKRQRILAKLATVRMLCKDVASAISKET
ncbi:hypothetical protein ASPZODRAFT_167684 [Penicilliopsis zonata CBS 506.65]|uniref:DUF7587 domain-containing protein n=1 Tax=Penicilliopsis zonata CBS 506.65 TaxID=1073090 RepID=A0A1L9SDF4_9EURO|nr:hypothetical protein ASPZODRAFT_167684 [Penicilliopsis zonata CBS 506.65]OJJ45211.1 hypothetical protein ASPZODRAFT_167684 [Penicilliopsis zonata CBS 506.65]